MTTYIILIAGGSASGKTTLANRLSEALSPFAIVISSDNYYKDLSHIPLKQREQFNFDHPQSIDNKLLVKHLIQLKRSESVRIPQYNFINHTRRKRTLQIQPHPIIIIEGLHTLLYPSLRNIADLKVFVELDNDLRFIRRLNRDISERKRTLEKVFSQYLNTVRPIHEKYIQPSKQFADLIVPGNQLGISLKKILCYPSLKNLISDLHINIT
ncbi:MAG: uridine kinase [Candidatus Hydrogenedens sp.]